MNENRGLWRGKRKDDNVWYEGAYSPYNWDFFGKREKNPQIIIVSNYKNIDGKWVSVFPETVGQYTGLTDKNGKKIFEGDIVRNNVGAVYIIKWDAERLAFVFSCFKCEIGKEAPRPLVVTYEIIGNEYDNPELLKGGENSA